MANPPPTQLVIRLGQLDTIAAADVSSPRLVDGAALYRLVGSEMPICSRHLSELAAYQPGPLEARAVLSVDQIDAIVAELGLRRDDLLRLHGPLDPLIGVECCRMCETTHVEGNVCHDDSCRRPLHPEWPVVYCSDDCALNDC